ncbi:MAG TPA: hypothetical protein EYP51_08085, partial [Thiotrichales bacterium]|nr:hypothetical protein [Thiotrichales bacterium]
MQTSRQARYIWSERLDLTAENWFEAYRQITGVCDFAHGIVGGGGWKSRVAESIVNKKRGTG